MGWASSYIEGLQRGETVSFRPRGNSMTPRIESGQLCTVEPVDITDLKKGDIVLCRISGTNLGSGFGRRPAPAGGDGHPKPGPP